MGVKGIIWDYDGTLVDTRVKNYNVARALLHSFVGERAKDFPAFASLEVYETTNRKYANWRELYHKEFGLNDEETTAAGSLWTEYQLRDTTAVEFYEGTREAITRLKNYPHGIVSQNSHQNIKNNLERHGILDRFHFIIGYEEVAIRKQKPDPAGLLMGISKIGNFNHDDVIIYVGDHDTDAHCANNANQALGRKAIVTVAAAYGLYDPTGGWPHHPDYTVHHPSEIVQIVESIDKT